MCSKVALTKWSSQKQREIGRANVPFTFRIRIIIPIALYNTNAAKKKVWILFIWISFHRGKKKWSVELLCDYIGSVVVRFYSILLAHILFFFFIYGLMQVFARLCKLCTVTANLAPYYMKVNRRITTITIFIKFIFILCALIYDRCDEFFCIVVFAIKPRNSRMWLLLMGCYRQIHCPAHTAIVTVVLYAFSYALLWRGFFSAATKSSCNSIFIFFCISQSVSLSLE